MAGKLRRTAAFAAIWRALVSSRSGPSLGKRLGAFPRMVWNSAIGRYDGLGRILLMGLATAYVASPIDLMPEIVLLLPGLIDDVVVAAWIAGAFLAETERFLLWEEGRKTAPVRIVEGEIA